MLCRRPGGVHVRLTRGPFRRILSCYAVGQAVFMFASLGAPLDVFFRAMPSARRCSCSPSLGAPLDVFFRAMPSARRCFMFASLGAPFRRILSCYAVGQAVFKFVSLGAPLDVFFRAMPSARRCSCSPHSGPL